MSLLEPITKAEHVSECLNRELSAYGLNTFVSPDKTSVLIDDQGMSQSHQLFQRDWISNRSHRRTCGAC